MLRVGLDADFRRSAPCPVELGSVSSRVSVEMATDSGSSRYFVVTTMVVGADSITVSRAVV